MAKKYILLKNYKYIYGNIDVPYNYVINNIPLGVFVANQRALKRKKKYPNEELKQHFKLLDELGMNWNPQNEEWITKYNTCKKFYLEKKHLNISEGFIYDNIDIGTFIANQRALYQKYQKGTLKIKDKTNLEYHFKLLNEIGIIWYPNKEKQKNIEEEIEKYNKEHGNINIPANYIVKINNEEFNLGMYISELREIYKKNINNLEKLNKSLKDKILYLNKLGISWNPNEEYWMLRYNLLKEYKKEHKNLNIKTNYIIKSNKEIINLGKFINKQRELYRKHNKNNFKNCDPIILNHFKLLDELGISWNPNKDLWKNQYNYLSCYYNKYGNLDIPINKIEIINGNKINIGIIAKNIKEGINKKKNEIEKGTATAETMLKYNLLKQIGFKFSDHIESYNYNGTIYNKIDLCKKLNIQISNFNKYIKLYDNDYKKTIRACLITNKIKESHTNKKENPTINNMLKTFNINIDELDKYLNNSKLKENAKKSNIILYSGNTKLKKYCIDKGFNYELINYILKVKQNGLIDETLDKVIDRVLIDYKINKIPTWIYSKYGNELLLRHFIISQNLNYENIINDMSKNAITLEEAIRNNCFYSISKKNKHEYLENLYIDIINKIDTLDKEQISNYINYIIKEYSLNNKEVFTLTESFKKYTNAIRKYHIYEVGNSNDNNKKIELINKYNLTSLEIEESFFININYLNHNLIIKNSPEYKRRKAIKKLVRRWNNINEEEKLESLKKNDLKYPDEYNRITIIRNNINHLQFISKNGGK